MHPTPFIVEVRAATGHRLLFTLSAWSEEDAMSCAKQRAIQRWYEHEIPGTAPVSARVLSRV